jgi:hypothetical protein
MAFPVGPVKRLTALSVNAAPDKGRRLASDARLPGRVLRRARGLSSLGVLLDRPRDASRSLPGSVHRPVSFLYVAQGRRRSSPCLFDVTKSVSGGPPHRPLPDDATRPGRGGSLCPDHSTI